jgi:hypothetical protein
MAWTDSRVFSGHVIRNDISDMAIKKGMKFTMLYSPSFEAEIDRIRKDENEVDVIMIPSDGNAFMTTWPLDETDNKFARGIYKIKEKEISFGI